MAHMMVTDGDGKHAPDTITAMTRDTSVQTVGSVPASGSVSAKPISFNDAASGESDEGETESGSGGGQTNEAKVIPIVAQGTDIRREFSDIVEPEHATQSETGESFIPLDFKQDPTGAVVLTAVAHPELLADEDDLFAAPADSEDFVLEAAVINAMAPTPTNSPSMRT
jgi:hypothetical protein